MRTVVFYWDGVQYRAKFNDVFVRSFCSRKGPLHDWVRVPSNKAIEIWTAYKLELFFKNKNASPQ